MLKNRVKALYVIFFAAFGLYGCKGSSSSSDTGAAPDPVTPVSVTEVKQQTISDSIVLNATATFLQKNYIKASSIGYLQSVNVRLGQHVFPGQKLFTIQTKEARTIGKSISSLDPSLNFSGIISVVANQAGFVTSLNHQKGDYLLDGEPLAIISNNNSFVFVLNLPFELRQYVQVGKSVNMLLPDGGELPGTIAFFMPVVDSLSQTQRVIIRANSVKQIPENLIVKVNILKNSISNSLLLPKAGVLTNETQDQFWVMKLINDSTAIKVPVKKGIESADAVQIISGNIAAHDKILTTGNYGLADTAKVKVVGH